MSERSNPIAIEIVRKLNIYKKQGNESDNQFLYRLARSISECPEDVYMKLSVVAQRWYCDFVARFQKDGVITGFPSLPFLPNESTKSLATNDLTQYFWNYDNSNPSNHGISAVVRTLILTRPYMTASSIKKEIYDRYQIVVNINTISIILSHFRASLRFLWTLGLVKEDELMKFIIPRNQPDKLTEAMEAKPELDTGVGQNPAI